MDGNASKVYIVVWEKTCYRFKKLGYFTLSIQKKAKMPDIINSVFFASHLLLVSTAESNMYLINEYVRSDKL